MKQNLIARASTTVNAGKDEVWAALVTPSIIKEYSFGADVTSDWKEGSRIVWKGEWEGKPFEDRGVVLQVRPGQRLQYSHFSPQSGVPDLPENHRKVTVELSETAGRTQIDLSQDGNPTDEARQHSEKLWSTMLDGLKKQVEGERAPS